MVRRGQIRDYVVGSRQLRLLVVSSDEYPRRWGLVVSSRGEDSRGVGRLVVTLRPGDPRAGEVIHIPQVLRIDETAIRTDHGYVTNETMNAVEDGLRAFLELS